jgi:hypothetical protein
MVLGFSVNHVVKVVLLVLLGLYGLAYWLLPGTRLVKRPETTERLFVATSIVGTICGALGLAVTLAWPRHTLEWHLWELLLMPLVGILTFWLILGRRPRGEPLLDEMQLHAMAEAGGAAIGASIVGSFVASLLHHDGVFDPSIQHPFNLCVIVVAYSVVAGLRFRRA